MSLFSKKAKKDGTYLGVDLFNMCECGATVERLDRQELVFYPEKNCFLRRCATCIDALRKVRFPTPPAPTLPQSPAALEIVPA